MHKKKFTTVVILLISFCLPAAAQVPGNFQYNQTSNEALNRNAATTAYPSGNEIAVRINGLMNIVAEDYVAIFNVTQVAENMAEADALITARISSFKRALRLIGVDTQTITQDMISFVPRYEVQTEKRLFSKSYNEVPAGFELQKNVAVHYRNAAFLDRIITAGVAAEIYDLVKVDYHIANLEKSLDSLRGLCLHAMKKRIKSYEEIGVRLDTLRKTMADNQQVIYPPSRYAAYQAFSRSSLNAAAKKSTEINTADRTSSRYYSQVPYDQYDLVANPVVKEPVVQLSYSLTVRYEVPQHSNGTDYLLTPSGELRKINPR